MQHGYYAERYEAAFDEGAAFAGEAEYAEASSARHVKCYRAKAIDAGKLLEIDCGAVWNTKAEAGRAKEAIKKQSAAAIEKRNQRNAEREITQLLNLNMGDGDIGMYLSFRDEPGSMKEIRRRLTWYVRKLRKAYAKRGWAEIKYLYILESADGDGNPVRPHLHFFLTSGGVGGRDLAEDIWRDAFGRANATRLETDEYGLTGFAMYVLKAPREVKNLRRWGCSRNMAKPAVRRSTRLPNGQSLTKRLIRDILSGKRDAREVFERAYRGYGFIDARAATSEYAAGVYLYVRMRKLRS